MCDDGNPQDKKILLLAELFEHKCDALAENQQKLKVSLDDTNKKLDRLTELLEVYGTDTHDCPVYKNKGEYEKISFYVKNPKLTLLILIGLLALLCGFFSSTMSGLLRGFIGV